MSKRHKRLMGNVFEKDGTLFIKKGRKYEPLRFDVHDAGGDGPDGDIINHENLQQCGWEVGDDSSHHFRSAAIFPSDCFNQDIERADGLSDEEIEAVKGWAEADLYIADQAFIDWAKPMEREEIKETFSDWLDDQDEDDGRTEEEKIQDFIREDQLDYTFFWYGRTYGLTQFHDEDEVEEICREYFG